MLSHAFDEITTPALYPGYRKGLADDFVRLQKGGTAGRLNVESPGGDSMGIENIIMEQEKKPVKK